MAASLGTTIGPYTIDREIGRGGMGIVYVGHDTRLGRPVAIKTLPDHFVTDPARRERFDREARALAALNHPGIAGIYGVEEEDGAPYLVLEYVAGETLADGLDRGALALDDALDFARQIAAAIEAAHAAGVIHRDLKPANVKVAPDGTVKVLDFGLAKLEETALTPPFTADSPTVTHTVPHSPTIPGAILGTAPYMSPEQARGRSLDARTDVWSFGVVLYECLCGSSPFVGETPSDSIGAILHKPVDLDALPATTPPFVRRVLERCLQRDRARRYHHMADVRLDLEDEAGATHAVAPARTTSGRWMMLAACVTLVASVATFGWYRAITRTVAPPVVRAALIAPEGRRFSRPIISADGRRVAMRSFPIRFGRPGESVSDVLCVRDLAAGEAVEVPGSLGVEHAAFSPDGRTLAFIARGATLGSTMRLFRVASDLSTPPVEIMTVPERMRSAGNGWFSWTPDGDLAYLTSGDPVLVVIDPGSGREKRRVSIASGTPLEFVTLRGPFADRHIVLHVNVYTPDGYRQDAGLLDVETGEVRMILENARLPMLTEDGTLLFARHETLYAAAFDRKQFKTTGHHRPVESDLWTHAPWSHGAYALSANGTLAFTPGGIQGAARSIVIIDADGTERTWSDERRPFEHAVCVSPDGRRLAVVIPGAAGGLFELWVSDVETPRLRRLLSAAGTDFFEPSFSHDGEHIVVGRWCPDADEKGTLLRVRFDGTGEMQRIFGGWDRDDWIVPTTQTPDGSSMLVLEITPRGSKLHEVDLEGHDEPRLLIEERAIYDPVYAPIGPPLLAYVSESTGRPEVFVRAVHDAGLGPPVPITSHGAWSVAWRLDADGGLSLVHTDLEAREWSTRVTLEPDLKIGASEPTGRTRDERDLERTMSTDGRLFVIRQGEGDRYVDHVTIVTGWADALNAN